MAKRSVRNKLRFQVQKAIEHQQRSLEHLVTLDTIADDRSGFITDVLPDVVKAVSGVQDILKTFRSKL